MKTIHHETSNYKILKLFLIALLTFGFIILISLIKLNYNQITYNTEKAKVYDELLVEFQERKVGVIVSYYTANPDETDSEPCITADGTNICGTDEKIIACNWLPFDTFVRIDGEIYRVADRMNRRYGEPYIDILVGSKEEAFKLGRQNKVIYILN